MNNTLLPPVLFYFIRHGQTEWNRLHKIMGHTDISLNSLGIEQATTILPSLEKIGIERIVTSHLQRASKTASIIGNYLHIAPQVVEGLSEICWGEWEGTRAIEEGHNVEKWISGYTPPGAESYIAFQKRIQKTFADLLTSPLRTLVVSHNGVYRALMKNLGYPNCNGKNCIPYCFQPHNDSPDPWLVLSLEASDETDSEYIIDGQKWFRVKL